MRILEEFRAEGQSSTYRDLMEVDYERVPVSIGQFLTDPDYMGKDLKGLYPVWQKDLREVFGSASRVVEWIMTGSIGCGKTTRIPKRPSGR